jgi:hypothetical protein
MPSVLKDPAFANRRKKREAEEEDPGPDDLAFI